jgi:hypothetical protein
VDGSGQSSPLPSNPQHSPPFAASIHPVSSTELKAVAARWNVFLVYTKTDSVIVCVGFRLLLLQSPTPTLQAIHPPGKPTHTHHKPGCRATQRCCWGCRQCEVSIRAGGHLI